LLGVAAINQSSITNSNGTATSTATGADGTGTGTAPLPKSVNKVIKTYYPELPLISPPPPPTLLPYKEAKRILLKKTDESIAKSVFAILVAEATIKNSSFSSAGGYNYAGVQTDAGRWSGGELFIGRFIRKDAVKLREFAQFASNETFLVFLFNRVKAKGFSGSDGQLWTERYLNNWVFKNLSKQDKAKYDKMFPQKLAIYNRAIRVWNSITI
jgi:hypothetical protein